MLATPFPDENIRAVFEGCREPVRGRLLALRELIFEVHRETEGVGHLVETLKWGQPAYLTEKPKSGTTIRIDAIKGDDSAYGLYVHCQTRLITIFRELYPDSFTFEGKRAMIFSATEAIPEAELAHCIALALTYHTHPMPV